MKNQEYKRNNAISTAISWMRFPLIFMIVLLHCYCAIDAHGHHSFFQWIYPFGLILGETGVPAFFFISGFLFFYSSKSYSRKIQSRVHTLLIPYVFWNGLILLAYLLLWLKGNPMMIMGKSIAGYGLVDYLRAFIDRGSWDAGNGVPLLCPYWYVRNLMVLCVFSPIIYYGIKYLKWIPIIALSFWWISIPYNGMIASSLLFFSFGAYVSIEQKNPINVLHKYKIVFISLWLVAFLIDWAHCFCNVPCALYVHRISLVLNIFMLLLIGGYLGHKPYPGRKLLDNSAFWIYTVHYPMTIAFGAVFARYLSGIEDWQMFVFYWCGVLCITVLCIVSYALLHRLCPKVLSFVTGNRS
jgi:peptidoglycan/LPS O-acetylase OafA/YrhL